MHPAIIHAILKLFFGQKGLGWKENSEAIRWQMGIPKSVVAWVCVLVASLQHSKLTTARMGDKGIWYHWPLRRNPIIQGQHGGLDPSASSNSYAYSEAEASRRLLGQYCNLSLLLRRRSYVQLHTLTPMMVISCENELIVDAQELWIMVMVHNLAFLAQSCFHRRIMRTATVRSRGLKEFVVLYLLVVRY